MNTLEPSISDFFILFIYFIFFLFLNDFLIGLPDNQPNNEHFIFHSGVSTNSSGKYITNGGRVLINVAIKPSLVEAAMTATDGCKNILFDGVQYRTDIARKGIQK